MKGKHLGPEFSLGQNPQFFDIFPWCPKDLEKSANAKRCKHSWHKSENTICHLEHGEKLKVGDIGNKKTPLNLIVDRDKPIDDVNAYALRSEGQEIVRASKNIWRLEGKNPQYAVRGANLT